MKLILAVVQDEDSHKVLNELRSNNFGATKLSSTGGFLRAGNTTLIVGVEEEKLEKAIEIIKKQSKSRKQFVSSTITPGDALGILVNYPIEVVVGGATIFVIDIERFEKV